MSEVTQWVPGGQNWALNHYYQYCQELFITLIILCSVCRRSVLCSPDSTLSEMMISWRFLVSPQILMWFSLTSRSYLLVYTVLSLMRGASTSWPWSPWTGRWCHSGEKSKYNLKLRLESWILPQTVVLISWGVNYPEYLHSFSLSILFILCVLRFGLVTCQMRWRTHWEKCWKNVWRTSELTGGEVWTQISIHRR